MRNPCWSQRRLLARGTADVRRLIQDELVEALKADELVARWQHHSHSSVVCAEDVIGEQRYWALAVLLGMVNGPLEQSVVPLARRILGSQPYLWMDEMVYAASQTRLPDHVVDAAVLPCPQMWWTIQTAHTARSNTGETTKIDAISLTDFGDGFEVVSYGSDASGMWAQPSEVRYGERATGEALVPLQLLSFLASPAVTKDMASVARPFRRRQERARFALPLPTVGFVNLRHVAREHRGGSEMPVDWSRRWLVRGHHRAQWYPSRQTHRVVWIPPYVKGPEGKPFVVTPARVVR